VTGKIVRGKILTETQFVDEGLSAAQFGTWQEDYPLREVEFERIVRGGPATKGLAINALSASFGFGVAMVATWFAGERIKSGHLWAVAICVALAAMLYGVGWVCDDRRVVLQKIRDHFRDAPTRRQALRKVAK